MGEQTRLPFLASLADMFRLQGDSISADVLMAERPVIVDIALTASQRDRVEVLGSEATSLDDRGAHDRAEPLWREALTIMEGAFGDEHIEICDSLNNLARCRYSAGKYGVALGDYARLHRITKRVHGPDDGHVEWAGDCIAHCRRRLRHRDASRGLQEQMMQMLRATRGTRVPVAAQVQERVRLIGQRLMARSHLSVAGRVYQAWILAPRSASSSPLESLLLDIQECAALLRQSGEAAQAASLLQSLIPIHNRLPKRAAGPCQLREALTNLQGCLEAMGLQRSARETAVLVEAIVARKSEAGKDC